MNGEELYGMFGIPTKVTVLERLPWNDGTVRPKLLPPEEISEMFTSNAAITKSSYGQLIQWLPKGESAETFGNPATLRRGLISAIRIHELGALNVYGKLLATKEDELEVYQNSRKILESFIQEFGPKFNISNIQEYLFWYARQAATNLAIMHVNDKAHTQLLNPVLNMTIACEMPDTSSLTDLNGLSSDKREELIRGDLGYYPDVLSDQQRRFVARFGNMTGVRQALYVLTNICSRAYPNVPNMPNFEELENYFLNYYQELMKLNSK